MAQHPSLWEKLDLRNRQDAGSWLSRLQVELVHLSTHSDHLSSYVSLSRRSSSARPACSTVANATASLFDLQG